MRIDLTAIQVKAIVAHIADELGEDDDRLLLDTLEGETDLFELTGKLLGAIEGEEGNIAALKSQIEDRQARKARCEQRRDTHRTAIMALMEAARQEKLTLPEATLSVRKVAPKAIVTNADLLPDELCTIVRKPNMAAIKEAETLPDGVALDNGGTSLTIRRK